MVTRHLLDSLVVLPHLGAAPVGAAHGRDSFRVVDVGAGAGLPGIPLALAKPALHVALLDSNGKKARFLRHAQRTLPLANVEVVEARAEAWEPPARYDAVVSRAFSALGEFLQATSRLAVDGGRWLAMKGKLDRKELADVPPGFRVEQEIQLQVPGLDEERHLIICTRT
jgi:16S rRNA (guanine527-N7)-methyltransferase